MTEDDDGILSDQSPLPPLQLTFEEQQHCHDLSLRLLKRTLLSYDERLAGITPRHHANLDSARWKLQKTQENASMYSERIRRIRTDLHLPEDNWNDPVVLMMVGTIPTPLDEVMLGVCIPTFEAFKIRVATLGNQNIGGAMLAKLVGSTEEKPFQSLSVMYMVNQLPWLVGKVVKPRDFLLLSATGIVVTAEGERIGYDLLQPAPLSYSPPVSKPIIRGKFMLGALYRQKVDGSVDVYIQQYLEANGNVFDSLVMNRTWYALLGFFQASVLAEHKKLQWCIANMKSSRRRGLANEVCGYLVNCSLCSLAFGRAVRGRGSDQQRCVLCQASVCSNCREEQVLRELVRHPRKQHLLVNKRRLFICHPCQEFVQRQKAPDIARCHIYEQLTPASDSAGDSMQQTWGLLCGETMPSWSPTSSLSISSESFDVFSWSADRS